MNTHRCAPLLSSEFSLTIALVVFVMITLFLITIIVLLCVSKSFRAFFFREYKDTGAPGLPAEPEPAAQPEQEPEQTRKRRKKRDPFGVPTVPLTFQAAEPEPKKPRSKKSEAPQNPDYIRTVEIGEIAPQSEKSTYVTRNLPKKTSKRR